MVIQWLSQNYIEVLGALTGLIYLYFSIKRIIWLWPLGIITSLLYIYVFYEAKFYADMSLQVYYFFISIYGWYHWLFGKEKNVKKDKGEQIPIATIGIRYWLILISITIILTVITGYILQRYTDSPLPYWDAFTTSGSVVATWMLARKMLENWLFWIVLDLVSMGMYIYKGLVPTVILFLVYSSMAIIGYFQWKKDMIKQNTIS